MKILGITSFVHDSSAALVCNGQLIANVEEERLNRDKHTDLFPSKAIAYVLEKGGIGLSDVDIIAFNWDPYRALREESLKLVFFARYFNVLKHNKPPKNFKTIFASFMLKRYLRKLNGADFQGEIVWVRHHSAHAASSYYLSLFDDADILILDGHGEDCSSSFFSVEENKLIEQWKKPIRHSLGIIYTNFTLFLGFDHFQEGKTMALASFGKDGYRDLFQKIIKLHPDGGFSVDPFWLGLWNYKSSRAEKEFGPYRQKDDQLEQRHMDIAFSMQKRIKEVVLHVLKAAATKSKKKQCCMGGGLFLNCDINRAVQESGFYEEYFIPPFASDTGGAVGAAFYVAYSMGYEKQARKKTFFSPFTGPAYTSEIRAAVEESGFEYTYSEEPWIEAARALKNNNIIGWFQGAVESGPRALGNRSILASPLDAEIRDKLNSEIKQRESFRPLAPVVTESAALKYFDIPEPIPETARYMLLTAVVKEEFREKLPGITHFDGTSRLQVVRTEWSPELYKLLVEVEKITGFAVLINTSFNCHEPIVCSPQDAVQTFSKVGLDMLVMGNYILRK